jgi:hypothetical protein
VILYRENLAWFNFTLVGTTVELERRLVEQRWHLVSHRQLSAKLAIYLGNICCCNGISRCCQYEQLGCQFSSLPYQHRWSTLLHTCRSLDWRNIQALSRGRTEAVITDVLFPLKIVLSETDFQLQHKLGLNPFVVKGMLLFDISF